MSGRVVDSALKVNRHWIREETWVAPWSTLPPGCSWNWAGTKARSRDFPWDWPCGEGPEEGKAVSSALTSVVQRGPAKSRCLAVHPSHSLTVSRRVLLFPRWAGNHLSLHHGDRLLLFSHPRLFYSPRLELQSKQGPLCIMLRLTILWVQNERTWVFRL